MEKCKMKDLLKKAATGMLVFAGVLAAASVSADAPASLTVVTNTRYKYEWDQDLSKSLCEFTYPEAHVTTDQQEKYPELAAALDRMNAYFEVAASESFDEWVTDAREMAVENPDYFMTFTDNRTLLVQRADEQAVSFLETMETFSGGVHGYAAFVSYNFDASDGKQLSISDVVTDRGGVLELLKGALLEKYEDLDLSWGGDILSEDNFENLVWTISPSGMTFWFGNYELGSYAQGLQNATVPFEGNEALFDSKYTDVPEEYSFSFPKWNIASVDVNNDGKAEQISFWAEGGESGFEKFCIDINGVQTSVNEWFYEYNGTYVVSGGKTFLYMELTSDNDYRIMKVFDLSTGTAVLVSDESLGQHYDWNEENEWGGEQQISDPSDFILDVRTDMLSTLSASRHYHTGSDGKPEPSGAGDWFEFGWRRTITALHDFDIVIVSEDGTETGSEVCAEGTELELYRTDNESWTDAYLPDGRIARIYVETETWPRTVDGMDIEELFEGVMFAG